jgi:hypothetical protein
MKLASGHPPGTQNSEVAHFWKIPYISVCHDDFLPRPCTFVICTSYYIPTFRNRDITNSRSVTHNQSKQEYANVLEKYQCVPFTHDVCLSGYLLVYAGDTLYI